MAVIPLTQQDVGGAVLVTWTGLTPGDTGQPFGGPLYGDRTVQFGGTFGASTVILEGSNDGATYRTLTDPQGNALSATSAAMEQVMETPRWSRPSVSAGAGSITVTMYARRTLR